MKGRGFKVLGVVILVALIALLNGCATMNDVVQVKEAGTEGTTKVYPVNVEQAWDISKAVFRWEGSDAIEEHKDQGYMLTSSGMNLVSWGAVMGAWIKPVDKGHTEVTVVTKRKVTVNVAIVKKGQPLPRNPPE
jgi:hypothetical protein